MKTLVAAMLIIATSGGAYVVWQKAEEARFERGKLQFLAETAGLVPEPEPTAYKLKPSN